MEKNLLVERIEKIQIKIQKKEKAIAKYQKIIDTSTNERDIDYAKSDLRYRQRELEDAQKTLAKYNEMMIVLINKENAPRIQALVDFLAEWKAEAKKFYLREAQNYIDLYKQEKVEEEKWSKATGHYSYWPRHHKGESPKLDEVYQQLQNVSPVAKSITYAYKEFIDVEELEKILSKEVERKYWDLVERLKDTVGEIKDATGLRVAGNCSINGIIKGTKCDATVETIMAGGYNIQCLHYRVLVHPIH